MVVRWIYIRTDWGICFVYAGFESFVFRAGASLALASPRKVPLAAPEPHRHQLPLTSTDDCCYIIITTTDYFHIPLHSTNLSAFSTTQEPIHSQARADTHHTSPTSHNTANMVLEATMIVYVSLFPEAPIEPRAREYQVTITDHIIGWTTPNPLVMATTYPHAGRRKPMPPTSSSTARPKRTPSQASVL